MLIPSTLEKIRKGDYSVKPFVVHKDFVISSADASELGYTVRRASYYKYSLPISSSKGIVINAPVSQDGTYNYQNWRSINHQYYNNPYDVIESPEGFNRNTTNKSLFLSASLVSAPYNDMGEGLRKSSVSILGDNLFLYDDGYYNLYDSTIDTGSFVDSTKLDAYWGFQDLYKKTKFGWDQGVSQNRIFYSNTREENLASEYHNIGISPGIPINATSSGAQLDFKGTSWVITPAFPEINYEKRDDFTISFFVKAPVSQADTTKTYNGLITKKTYVEIVQQGSFRQRVAEGGFVIRYFQSSSIIEDPSPVYPYDISIYNQTAGSAAGKVRFRRSDGEKTLELTSSIALNDGNYHNVCITKSGSLISLYTDGDLQSNGGDIGEDPTNDYHLIFGAYNQGGTMQFSGSLDEVRFYSTAASPTQVTGSLAEKYQGKLYQTRNVGNVFYKRGEAIITSPIRKYHDEFNNNSWSFNYKNNYTIYEYEVLTRIKAGRFNKTMNPSSIESPKSNLYIGDFSGSLSPYATTVGLYNENFQLVAVGKFGRPLKMRSDTAINVIVRWDY